MSTPNIIPSYFTAVNGISKPVGIMSASIKGLGATTQAEAARMELAFNRTSTAAMGLYRTTIGVGIGIMLPLAAASKVAMDFGQQMGNVGTLVDTTRESMDAMSESVLKLGREIPKSYKDLTDGLYQVRSAGIEAGDGINQAFGVLASSGRLAVTGLSTVEEATKGVTSAINVFADAGLNSEQIANSFFKTIQSGKTKMSELSESFGKNAAIMHEAGVTLYEMNAATGTLTLTGIAASQAQNELAASVIALMKPTGDMISVFNALGYAGEGGFKRLIKDAGGLVPAMKKVNDQAAKLGISMSDDFGRKEALVANTLLTGTLNKEYAKQLGVQTNAIDTLSEKFEAQSKTAAAQMVTFRNNVEALGISIGNALLPALNDVTAAINPVIIGIGNFTKDHKALTAVMIDSVGTVGLFALGISGVSYAVGTATKAYGLYNSMLVANTTITTIANRGIIASIANFNAMPFAIRGATFAMKGFQLATSAAFGELLVAYGIYKTVVGALDEKKRAGELNPLGLDMEGKATDKGNARILHNAGKTEGDFIKMQKYYHYKKQKDLMPGEYYNMMGGKSTNPFYRPTDRQIGVSADSTGIKAQMQIDQEMNTDSTFKAANGYTSNTPPPVMFGNSALGNGGFSQDSPLHLVVTLENNSTYSIGANVVSNNTAAKLSVKALSTTKRKDNSTDHIG